MKSLSTLFLCFILGMSVSYGQLQRIEESIDLLEAESHLRFLTSDELKGRDTGSEELVIAGRYIAEQFRRYGVSSLGDQEGDYFQKVPLVNTTNASRFIATRSGTPSTASNVRFIRWPHRASIADAGSSDMASKARAHFIAAPTAHRKSVYWRRRRP